MRFTALTAEFITYGLSSRLSLRRLRVESAGPGEAVKAAAARPRMRLRISGMKP